MSFPDGLKLDQGLTALDKRKGDGLSTDTLGMMFLVGRRSTRRQRGADREAKNDMLPMLRKTGFQKETGGNNMECSRATLPNRAATSHMCDCLNLN